MKDRLIELIGCATREYAEYSAEMYNACNYGIESMEEYIASYLLRNVGILPPCKVGDKVYLLIEKIIGEHVVVESICKEIHDKGFGKAYFMHIDCPEIGNTLEFYLEDFGRTVFLTKEEAQKALGGAKK